MNESLWLRPDDVGQDEARFIKMALGLRKGHRVLDAPCGAGRVAFHLARAGCVVTGIDLREPFVRRAKRRFHQAGLKGTFIVMDLRRLNFENQFHGIYNWLGSFGYFADSENFEILQRYTRALCLDGRLLIDQPNREFILRHFIAERNDENMIVRNRWDKRTQRIISRRILDGEDNPKNMSSMRIYTPGQVRGMFERVGLQVEAMYGAFDGDEYRRSSRRMILIGRKRT